jgi:DNA modification methylase
MLEELRQENPQLARTSLYSRDKNNVGNMIGKTYVGEMLKVYRECYRVLKPGKFMVVIVKDIQRNWKTVPLGAETIKLCQLAGFDCHDIIINKMYFPSFWMLSLAKKAQKEDVVKTEKFHALKSHEYVFVFRKPLDR